jgi:hypothetical protein
MAPDLDLEILLPGHRSPREEIARALCDLRGLYHRYLHQDELGPTRGERMAALRSLSDRLDLLVSRINELPADVRQWLSQQLIFRPSSLAADIDKFEAHCNDEEAVRLIAEAATGYAGIPSMAPATDDARLMEDLCRAAQRTIELLSGLDTTTEGAVVLDSELPPLEIRQGRDSDLAGFAIACARIERLRCRVREVLAGLKRRKGAECSESLRLLVWQLCDLYARETGKPVTNSAISKDEYTSEPQSPAGRFVLAAADALQPSEAWMREHDQWVRGMRARILHKGGRKRAVYFAMRDYVAHHSSSTSRRGRWKRRH